MVIGRSNSYSPSSTIYNIVVMRLNKSGIPLWTRIFNTDSPNYDLSLDIDGDGNIFWTGSHWDATVTNSYDILVGKIIGATGYVPWMRRIGTSGEDISTSITLLSNNQKLVIAGWSINTSGLGRREVLAAKLDTSGNNIWSKIYSSVWDEYVFCVREHSNGELYLAGGANSSESLLADALLMKLNANGNFMWSHQYGKPNTQDVFRSLTFKGSDTIAACGEYSGRLPDVPQPSFSDVYTVLASTNDGTLYKGVRYNFKAGIPDGGNDICNCIIHSHRDHRFVLAGASDSVISPVHGNPTRNTDLMVMEIHDTLGPAYWTKIYRTTDDEYGRHVVKFTEQQGHKTKQGYWVTGLSTMPVVPDLVDTHIYVLKTNINGETNCNRTRPVVDSLFNPNSEDTLIEFNYVVPTEYDRNFTKIIGTDYVCSPAIIYPVPPTDAPTGLNEIDNAAKLWPNPVYAGTDVNLLFNAPKPDRSTIIIADIKGRIVFESIYSVNEGENTVTINTEGFGKGLYLIRVTIEQEVLTRKHFRVFR